jgi:hypothetical protein
MALVDECRKDGNFDILEDQSISIQARLSKTRDLNQPDEIIYRLDFDIEKKRSRTFALRPTSTCQVQPLSFEGLLT